MTNIKIILRKAVSNREGIQKEKFFAKQLLDDSFNLCKTTHIPGINKQKGSRFFMFEIHEGDPVLPEGINLETPMVEEKISKEDFEYCIGTYGIFDVEEELKPKPKKSDQQLELERLEKLVEELQYENEQKESVIQQTSEELGFLENKFKALEKVLLEELGENDILDKVEEYLELSEVETEEESSE